MDLSTLDIATVGSITVLCYAIGYCCKMSQKMKDNLIPIVVLVSGAVLGAIGKFTIAEYPAEDVMTAVAVGIVSGMASTWVNQVYKQFKTK